MEYDVILELKDGRTEETQLARPFTPEDNEISVILTKTGKVHAFPLAKVCCIQMPPEKQPITLTTKDHFLENVITESGKQYKVHMFKDQRTPLGFYALSTDFNSPYKLLFFPKQGIKAREQERYIGEILEEKGLITRHSVEQTLEEQKELRDQRLGAIISKKLDVPYNAIENAIGSAYREGRAKPRMKVGDILIEAGLVTREQVEEAYHTQEKDKKKKIGSMLVEKRLITENQLLMALAVKFRMSFIDLNERIPTKEALAALPASVVYDLKVLPLEDDGKNLVVSTSEPTDHTIQDALRFYANRRIEMVVSTSQQINEAILKYYPKQTFSVDDILSEMVVDKLVIDQKGDEEKYDVSESDSQIVMLVNKILLDGYTMGASDIHMEPGNRKQPFQVRYRIDGICRVIHQIPVNFKKAIISRIKIISNLDITERRKPQSGKIIVRQQNNNIEYRVEITPTVGGNEDAVLRILSTFEPLPVESLDLTDINLSMFKHMLSQPYGIILCVGPTGSGKTTTLHSALRYLNTPEIKIWTAEDPVEITQPGLRQVQVNPGIGFTFEEAFRSFLRADPDIIMIGEMRDQDTVRAAIEASLTGHLVLSTLHTNSAPETVVRLIDMGMDPFNFSDALLGVLAQRLARRLCGNCKSPYHPSKDEFDMLVKIYDLDWYREHQGVPYSEGLLFMKKTGCYACNGSGYKGRIAIHELLRNTEAIKQVVRHRGAMDELRTSAMREGMKTLLMDGIQKVFQGLTDAGEILKVCRHEK